jgi:hypothetical protein
MDSLRSYKLTNNDMIELAEANHRRTRAKIIFYNTSFRSSFITNN